jgi:hypothetical protein
MTRRQALQLGAALGGALLLSLPAARFRLEIGCVQWPADAALWAGLYLVALAGIAYGWIGWMRDAPRPWLVLVCGAAVHALALLPPPFLSMDPIFYAATGRAMARFGQGASMPLDLALPRDDPFFLALGADWRAGTSAYFFGWNELARAIAWIGGDSLTLQLGLYQTVGALAMLGAAWLVSRAVEARDAGRAAATVLLCPLAVVEASQAAHNDALLALATAAFALAVSRKRPLAGLAALAAGLAVKASALLLLGFDAIALGARRRRRATAVFALTVTIVAVILAPTLLQRLGHFPLNYCARSLECLVRDPLYRHRHLALARAIGMLFRAAGTGWILWAGLCAGRDRRTLAWAGFALFGYFTFFHAYWQAWYLLPLMPLLPFSDEKWRPALLAACLSAPAHYAIVLACNCTRAVWLLRLESWADTAVVLGPAAIALVVIYRRSRAKATAETPGPPSREAPLD